MQVYMVRGFAVRDHRIDVDALALTSQGGLEDHGYRAELAALKPLNLVRLNNGCVCSFSDALFHHSCTKSLCSAYRIVDPA